MRLEEDVNVVDVVVVCYCYYYYYYYAPPLIGGALSDDAV